MKVREKEEARKLRSEGMSVNDICLRLHVSKSSVSYWVRDIALTEEQRDTLNKKMGGNHFLGAHQVREKFLEMRKEYQREGREMVKLCDKEFIAGIMLYWCEGSKSRNSIKFCNSDVNMVSFFVRFLRKHFNVANEKIRLSIRWYSGNGLTFEQIKNHWTKALDLEDHNLRKCLVDYHGGTNTCSNKGKLPYGIGTINVNDSKVTQAIFGAIQEYVGFTNENWLWGR